MGLTISGGGVSSNIHVIGQYAGASGPRTPVAFTTGNGIRGLVFPVAKTETFNAIAVSVTTLGTAGAAFRAGVFAYNPDTGTIGNLVFDPGSDFDTTTTGFKEITGLSFTLGAGQYVLAGACKTAGCSLMGMSDNGAVSGFPRFDAGGGNVAGYAIANALNAGALPASAGGQTLVGNCPIVAIRRSA